MIELADALDYLWMFLIAAALGAIGGVAFELLLARGGEGEAGAFELPSRKRGRRFLDLGSFASLIVGAIAAVAATYFFTPEVREKEIVDGVEQVTIHWEVVRLVPLSLLVGTAGGAFLKAAQARIVARVTEESAARTQAVAPAAAKQLQEASLDLTEKALSKVTAEVQPAIANALHEAAAANAVEAKPEERVAAIQQRLEAATAAALHDVDERLQKQVEVAKATIEAAATGSAQEQT